MAKAGALVLIPGSFGWSAELLPGRQGFGELPGSGEVRSSPGMPLKQGPGSLVGPPLT